MIAYINRKNLNIQKYDNCIQEAIQSNIFGYSWYLDIVTDNWGALVYGNYDAVMPLPWRKKVFIKYVYPPLWLIQLGIYSKKKNYENKFLIELFNNFKFVELKMNPENSLNIVKEFQKERQLQILSLKESYSNIKSNYNRNRKRELLKAIKFDLTEHWEDSPNIFVQLFKNNVGRRIHKIQEKDYNNLIKLMETCIAQKKGELLTVYDKNNKLVSGAFFLKQTNRITELVCASDFSNRKNGANTFMNDRAIFKYQKHFEIFDFGGSSIKSIASYYRGFGATNENYIQLYYNKLPKLIKLIKYLLKR